MPARYKNRIFVGNIKIEIMTLDELKEERSDRIYDFLEGLNTDIDLAYTVENESEDIEDFDDLYDKVDNSDGFNVDIIYYSNAMDYLREHDISLSESMALAEDMGYRTRDINSELLASLLASQNIREQFLSLESEVNDFFSELDEWYDEEYDKIEE